MGQNAQVSEPGRATQVIATLCFGYCLAACVSTANPQATRTPSVDPENPAPSRQLVRPRRHVAVLDGAPRVTRTARRSRTTRTARRIALSSDAEGVRRGRSEVFRAPLRQMVVTSPFGERRHPIHRRRHMHRGIDLRAARGTPVYATASGEAVMAGYCDSGTGNCIVLDHAGGWRSQYFHLSRVRIGVGDRVSQGQHIGDVGSSGLATGPHLHFQLGRGRHAVDPMTLIGTPVEQ